VLVAVVTVARDGPDPLAAPSELDDQAAWAAPNRDLAGTRAAQGSRIDSTTVASLRRVWRFRVPEQTTYSGLLAGTTLVLDGTVYVQTLRSNVYALDAGTGRVRWRRSFDRVSGGPNGLAAADGRLFGSTDTTVFALDRATGAVVWSRRLTTPSRPLELAPAVAGGLLFTSSVAQEPGGKGVVYALDAADGVVRWRFTTVRDPWANPRVASGGGAWWTPTVDAEGTVYVGTANPLPWGGTPAEPNGAAYRGPALYTDSLLAFDGRTGGLRWFDQVTPHDVRDYDFAVPPILVRAEVGGEERDLVVGGGKAGRVIAWDREQRRRLWSASVGRHLNDLGPLPVTPVTVCPGLFGGILTPMAVARDTVYVPVVELCMRGGATGYDDLGAVDLARARGELVALDVASGAQRWRRPLPSPVFGCATVVNDLVLTATHDGTVYVLSADDGRVLRRLSAPAGINACPTVSGDLLVVPAGAEPPGLVTPRHVVDAYALP
jgi:outer membrane protein assembly factor BamB